MKPNPDIYFIDADIYHECVARGISAEQIIDTIYRGPTVGSKFDDLTASILKHTHEQTLYVLGIERYTINSGGTSVPEAVQLNPTRIESEAREHFNMKFKQYGEAAWSPQCCEVKVNLNGSLFILMKAGFVHYLANNKDVFLETLLTVSRQTSQYSATAFPLMREYFKTRMNAQRFSMVTMRSL